MTTTLKPLPERIYASIHQGAIDRVSRFYNSSTTDCLNEMLQNCRRSGATEVLITLEDDCITIADDGGGIADPNTLLAFGQSQWDYYTTNNEDPAGMGLYSLAQRDYVIIESRHGNGPAWKVELTPDHFVGKKVAPIRMVDTPIIGSYTIVTFSDPNAKHSMNVVEQAIRYYPLPVKVNNEEAHSQVDFLNDACYVEEWEGLRIGAYRNRYGTHTHLNFHGLTVNRAGLPEIETLDYRWTAYVDVMNCPRMELTLPARKEVVENPFMEELRQQCRRVIYQAILNDPEPVDVSRKQYDEAHQMGVMLPEARPMLARWSAPVAYDMYVWNGMEPKPGRVPVDENTIVMHSGESYADDLTLERAFDRNGMSSNVLDANTGMEGYEWYDRLQKVDDLRIRVTEAGKVWDLMVFREVRRDGEKFNVTRPGEIDFVVTTRNRDGCEKVFTLQSDLAFANEWGDWVDDANPVVTRSSDIDVGGLTDMMVNAFFHPSDDGGSDSYATQREREELDYTKLAAAFLQSESEAEAMAIEIAVEQHVKYEVPRGATATIVIAPGQRIQVTLERSEPAE